MQNRLIQIWDHALLGFFKVGIWKSFTYIWSLHRRICQNAQSFFGIKNALFRLEFRKTIVILEISTLQTSNLGSKMPYLGIFWMWFWKNYCHIWNHYSRIWQNAKLSAKIKILKFRTKNAIYGYFRINFGKSIVTFEISTLEIAKKFLVKIKAFGQKCRLSCSIFGLQF